MDLPIRRVMTPFPYAIDAQAEVLAARKLMLEHKVRHLPAISSGKLVGLITDRDIKLMLGPEFDYPEPRELTVADVMIDNPYVVEGDTPLVDVLRNMTKRHIGAVLITRDGDLAGIFTATDACRHLADAIEGGVPTGQAGSGLPT
ncbi:MAG: CBS domain-containing protein [Pseudomonadales bacterium]